MSVLVRIVSLLRQERVRHSEYVSRLRDTCELRDVFSNAAFPQMAKVLDFRNQVPQQIQVRRGCFPDDTSMNHHRFSYPLASQLYAQFYLLHVFQGQFPRLP